MKATQQTVTLTARNLPAWVHSIVKHMAKREQRALNGQVVVILEEYANAHRNDACADGVHVYDHPNRHPDYYGKPTCRCGKVMGVEPRTKSAKGGR